MAIRARYKVEVALSSNTSEQKDLGNLKYEVVNDDQGEGVVTKMVLAVNATDVQIPLGVIATAKFILIKTNAKDTTQNAVEIQIKRNSTGGEALPITPFGTKEGILLLSTSGLTALYATNPSGSVVMELTLVAAGD